MVMNLQGHCWLKWQKPQTKKERKTENVLDHKIPGIQKQKNNQTIQSKWQRPQRKEVNKNWKLPAPQNQILRNKSISKQEFVSNRGEFHYSKVISQNCQQWDSNPRPFGPVPETGALDQLGHIDTCVGCHFHVIFIPSDGRITNIVTMYLWVTAMPLSLSLH